MFIRRARSGDCQYTFCVVTPAPVEQATLMAAQSLVLTSKFVAAPAFKFPCGGRKYY